MVRFHGLDKEPHHCPLPCQPNLCKGRELEKLIDAQAWEQVIYMGDSTNDFCPSTRLQSKDVVLARAGLLLEKEIKENLQLVKVQVIYWHDAKDVLRATQAIVDVSASFLPTVVSSSSTSSSKPTELMSPIEASDTKFYAHALKA